MGIANETTAIERKTEVAEGKAVVAADDGAEVDRESAIENRNTAIVRRNVVDLVLVRFLVPNHVRVPVRSSAAIKVKVKFELRN